MLPRRYSFIVANRDTGVTSRFTLRIRRAALWTVVIGAALSAVGLHTVWRTQATIDDLTLRNAQLELENSSYRTTASELSAEVAALQGAMADLAVRSHLDPETLESMERLPITSMAELPALDPRVPESPTRMFDRLGRLLGSIDHTLQRVRYGVAYREALADATPLIWPVHGWISATYGYREDPFTGQRDFHHAVDISTRKGEPVAATGTGRVLSASRNGAYGNLVEIDHGFGVLTRYGHLSSFAVEKGATVRRGDTIGYVGATGRATGYHVHYEVWVGDKTINPMQLLPDRRPLAAN